MSTTEVTCAHCQTKYECMEDVSCLAPAFPVNKKVEARCSTCGYYFTVTHEVIIERRFRYTSARKQSNAKEVKND